MRLPVLAELLIIVSKLVQGSDLTRQLKSFKQAVNSTPYPALAGLFQGQNRNIRNNHLALPCAGLGQHKRTCEARCDHQCHDPLDYEFHCPPDFLAQFTGTVRTGAR